MKIFTAIALAAAGVSLPVGAFAQLATVNDPAPGATAIMNSDYSAAVKEIQSAPVSPYDPARSINLGIAFAKMGDAAKAEREFRQVLNEEDVQIVVANGGTFSSHEVASRALDSLKAGALSR